MEPPRRYSAKNALAGLLAPKPTVNALAEVYRPAGLLAPGNIDLTKRPQVKNSDGSISTVRSMSFTDESGREILIPTVHPSGYIMSDDEAVRYYYQMRNHLGIFNTPQNADTYAQRLHEDQAKFYGVK